jgi:hypothetical protein
MKPTMVGAPLLALALVVTCLGCGGGQEEATPTPTATPTPVVTPTPTPTATPTPEPTVAYEIYSDDVNGFAITYPETWQQTAVRGTLFALESGEPCGGYPAVFSLRKLDLPISTDVESFFGSVIGETFSSTARNFVSGERMGVSGRAAIKWVTLFADEGGVPIREMTFYLLGDDAGWILSFTTVSSCWKEHVDLFEEMADSFLLLR